MSSPTRAGECRAASPVVKGMVRVEICINIVLGHIKPLKKVEESHDIY